MIPLMRTTLPSAPARASPACTHVSTSRKRRYHRFTVEHTTDHPPTPSSFFSHDTPAPSPRSKDISRYAAPRRYPPPDLKCRHIPEFFHPSSTDSTAETAPSDPLLR